MTNNDIFRQLRYIFNISDQKMVQLFEYGNVAVTQTQIADWLKKEDDPAAKMIKDSMLAAFLNGFIASRRGIKEGEKPVPEAVLTNNLVLRKLKIALSFQDTDMLEILALAGFTLSKHELSAFFRNPKQPQYRTCNQQVLRNFLHGLQLKYRPET
jgi:uncharacterized protein YehS (DUF1456 family)